MGEQASGQVYGPEPDGGVPEGAPGGPGGWAVLTFRVPPSKIGGGAGAEPPGESLMPDRPWKQEERHVARLLGGSRYPANSGGRIDVEGPHVVAQVKHVRRLPLAQLEALAAEMADLGRKRGKMGLVVVKRRSGRGQQTPRLVVMTEPVWLKLSCVSMRHDEQIVLSHSSGPNRLKR